ncbi:MAG: hypothetical protein K2X87_21470 [Gemmataceae bacterium]|nr:hypothetical protein [Gemmataceae bacterium]
MAKSAKAALALTREQFRGHAKPLPVVINGKELTAMAKEFSTGSLGWNINDKLAVEVGGQTVMVQVGLNLTIIGSKDLPQDGGGPPAAAPPVAAPAADTPPDASGQASF